MSRKIVEAVKSQNIKGFDFKGGTVHIKDMVFDKSGTHGYQGVLYGGLRVGDLLSIRFLNVRNVDSQGKITKINKNSIVVKLLQSGSEYEVSIKNIEANFDELRFEPLNGSKDWFGVLYVKAWDFNDESLSKASYSKKTLKIIKDLKEFCKADDGFKQFLVDLRFDSLNKENYSAALGLNSLLNHIVLSVESFEEPLKISEKDLEFVYDVVTRNATLYVLDGDCDIKDMNKAITILGGDKKFKEFVD